MAGRLLAYLTRPEHPPISILQIFTAQEQINDAPRDIMEKFLDFYKDLYSSRAEYTDSQLNDYLAQISLPSLLSESCGDLEAPLSVEEIAMAILQLPTQKTPGLIRLPRWMVLPVSTLNMPISSAYL